MNSRVPNGDAARRSPELDNLAALLIRLGGRSLAYFGAVATEIGLPPPVTMALQRIDPARPGPMHELAGAMGCDPSYVTWLADQLEAKGLAERQLATYDRRVKVLALTPAGMAVREQVLDRLAQVPFPLESLSSTEAASLSELLARLLGDELAAGADQCAVAVRPQLADHQRTVGPTLTPSGAASVEQD